MLAALDVQYDDSHSTATAAAVLFEHWDAPHSAAEYVTTIQNIHPYIPGQFFRRELPCLLAILDEIPASPRTIIIDGYVHLNNAPALGQHLFNHLSAAIPIIGVAKTPFRNAAATKILRGASRTPLWITAAGLDEQQAAQCIQQMHGQHRIPTLLKRADRLARAG